MWFGRAWGLLENEYRDLSTSLRFGRDDVCGGMVDDDLKQVCKQASTGIER
jgi:hypothetical protein